MKFPSSSSFSCRNSAKPRPPIFVWRPLLLGKIGLPPSLPFSPAECEPTSGVKRPENWDKEVHVGQPEAQRPSGPDAALLPFFARA